MGFSQKLYPGKGKTKKDRHDDLMCQNNQDTRGDRRRPGQVNK